MPVRRSLGSVKDTVRNVIGDRQELQDKAKDLPIHVARAAVTGIGYALLLADRMRGAVKRLRPEEQAPAKPSAGKGEPRVVPSSRPAHPAAPAAPAPVAAEPAAAERQAAEERPAAGPTRKPPAKTSRDAEAKAAAEGKAETVSPPGPLGKMVERKPIPGYDELSVPSLRARLRGLSLDQVRELRDYEKATAARDEVLRMYENRIAKLESGQ